MADNATLDRNETRDMIASTQVAVAENHGRDGEKVAGSIHGKRMVPRRVAPRYGRARTIAAVPTTGTMRTALMRA